MSCYFLWLCFILLKFDEHFQRAARATAAAAEGKLIVVLVFICLFAHSNHSTFLVLSRSLAPSVLCVRVRVCNINALCYDSQVVLVLLLFFLSYHFNSRALEFSTVFIELIQFQREHIIHTERNFIEAINQHQLKCVAGVSDNKSSIA